MKTLLVKLSLLTVVGCALTLAPFPSSAQEKKDENAGEKSGQGEAKKVPNPNRAIPFRGKVDSVDKSAMTVKVGTRVFTVSAETKILKDNKAATLADVVVGEPIRGSYRQAENGKLSVISLNLGAKEAEPKTESEKPAVQPEKPIKRSLKVAPKNGEKVPE